ncbi:glycosyltransferase [Ruicaihuangia caeni]|uniref:Glycosyltransferase n=1 Tax=Ruicaihuangia caeni TaxID=3042517 RepID=A0AAW6T3F5_9MICO|nr:glycosyltransferase [Klugiella sp. YN-L-19]MDI2097979.1 glycosyltransferase [Klugiella sp. YN-L-19]
MKIGIIAPPWIPIPPPAYGGIEYFIDLLARELAAAGHDVVLAASGDSTCPVRRLPGFPAADAAGMGHTAHELSHVLRAYEAVAHVDVVVDNTIAGPVIARSVRLRAGVTVAHGALVPRLQEIFAAAGTTMSFVAISHHQASTARQFRFAEVIHHGIDVDAVPVGPGGEEACFVGRMSPDKGVVQAISAARSAGIRLRIAAKMREASECEYFESAVRPLLGPRVEYLGELSASEKFELMGSSCALLNPIQWDEPFGLAMIESLATGTPVVATGRGSAPEIVVEGETGFIRGDPDELAEALQRASSLARSSCRADARVRFSGRRMASDYASLFARLTARRDDMDPFTEVDAAGELEPRS